MFPLLGLSILLHVTSTHALHKYDFLPHVMRMVAPEFEEFEGNARDVPQDPVSCNASVNHAPVIVVSPFTGSQLDVKLVNKTVNPHPWICSTDADWDRMWAPPTYDLLPGFIDCLADNLRFIRTPSKNASAPDRISYDSAPGTFTRLAYENLTGCYSAGSWDVYKQFVDNMVANYSYTIGCDVFGHSYDWRLGPNVWADDDSQEPSFRRLKTMIEDVVKANGRPVALIGLSMGGPYVSTFLSQYIKDAAWRSANVRLFASLSGVYGGSVAATQAAIAREMTIDGYSGGFYMLQAVSTFPAVAWMLANTSGGYDSQSYIVRTPNRTYTAAEQNELLMDAGRPDTLANWEAVRQWDSTLPPLVPTFCSIGTDVPTLSGVVYEGSDMTNGSIPYRLEQNLTGDGTVAIRSLEICSGWASRMSFPVTTVRWPDMLHASEARNYSMMAVVIEAVLKS